MDFVEIMHTYFRGERLASFFVFAPVGLLLIGVAAAALFADRGGFGWGLAVPLALFGLVAIGVGVTVGARTPGQVEQLERAYDESPAAMVAEELPRMQRVNANWPRLMAVWAGLVVVGLALRFLLGADWAHGVGPALVMIGAVGLLIDGFAERRAQIYTAALESLASEHGAAAGELPP